MWLLSIVVLMARWWVLVAVCICLQTCANAADKLQSSRKNKKADLPPAQQAEVDDMVNNLLHWIQGLYSQRNNNRFARQYFNARPEKPRPFQPASYLPPVTGYPPAGNRPTPSYEEGPVNQPPTLTNRPAQPTQAPYSPSQETLPPYQPSYQPSQPAYEPGQSPSQPSQPGYQPSQPTYQPSQPTYQPSQPTYQPSQPTYQPSSPTFQPSQPEYTNQPTQPSQTETQPPNQYLPSQPEYQPEQPSISPEQPTAPTYQPSQPAQQPSQPSYQPSGPTSKPSEPSYQPSQPTAPDFNPTNEGGNEISTPIETQPTSPTVIDNPTPSGGDSQGSSSDDDDRHPPHIHAITVDCGKEMMTINIEFNKPYNGIIYSQDHFNEQECVYVRENSNQVKFSFTVSLNSCGTKFFSDFENEGQAYLENVLVLQNEPGIQEVWDHIRRVRCLWEGNLTKQLVSSLSVGMLNQITSNFSGDTAMARLDIQMGTGPFAPEANGLTKIGERMTLVVSVMGDAGFDVLVRECVARDADSKHQVMLTDRDGCVLKPKLFGAFQKTKETGNTGASILAYAFFNAFKFPDEMDLIIQCDVELCKTDCDVCPNPGELEPKRRKRDLIHVGNRTVEPSTTISKGLRVVFAEDLPQETGYCFSPIVAVWGSSLVVISAVMSSAVASYCWMKSQKLTKYP